MFVSSEKYNIFTGCCRNYKRKSVWPYLWMRKGSQLMFTHSKTDISLASRQHCISGDVDIYVPLVVASTTPASSHPKPYSHYPCPITSLNLLSNLKHITFRDIDYLKMVHVFPICMRRKSCSNISNPKCDHPTDRIILHSACVFSGRQTNLFIICYGEDPATENRRPPKVYASIILVGITYVLSSLSRS